MLAGRRRLAARLAGGVTGVARGLALGLQLLLGSSLLGSEPGFLGDPRLTLRLAGGFLGQSSRFQLGLTHQLGLAGDLTLSLADFALAQDFLASGLTGKHGRVVRGGLCAE